jgi:hypothetical protein
MAKRAPAPADDNVFLSFRIGPDLVRALDAEVARLRLERPGTEITRPSVAREVLGRALLAAPAKRPRMVLTNARGERVTPKRAPASSTARARKPAAKRSAR